MSVTAPIGFTEAEIATGDALAAQLERSWWYYLIAGIFGVLLGFVVLEWRTETLYALTYFAGAVYLFIGLVRLIDVFFVPAQRWLSLLSAVVYLAIGVLIVAWPNITLFIVDLLIALGFVMFGVLELVRSFSNSRPRHWWISLLAGIASIVIAIWAIRHPGNALNVLIFVLGIWVMLWGVTEIISAFIARHARRHWAELTGRTG